jgi:hypothetical protein
VNFPILVGRRFAAALIGLLFVENRKKKSGGKAPHSKKRQAPLQIAPKRNYSWTLP